MFVFYGDDFNDIDSYAVVEIDYLSRNKTYGAIVYDTNEEGYASAVFILENQTETDFTRIMAVSGVVDTLREDGSIGSKVTGLVNGQNISCFISDKCELQLKNEKSVILFSLNHKNEISDFKVIASEKSFENYSDGDINVYIKSVSRIKNISTNVITAYEQQNIYSYYPKNEKTIVVSIDFKNGSKPEVSDINKINLDDKLIITGKHGIVSEIYVLKGIE